MYVWGVSVGGGGVEPVYNVYVCVSVCVCVRVCVCVFVHA